MGSGEWLLLRHIGRLFTSGPAGVIEDAAVAARHGRITYAGTEADLPPGLVGDAEEIDAEDALVTAGLVDAHTHPVYGGDRFAEIARRSAGATYAELAAEGGGIASSVSSTRATPAGDLEAGLRVRLLTMLGAGTTTLEAKSGYHLERKGELADVEMLARLGSEAGLPSIEVTFLAAHAVPPEHISDPDGYLEAVCSWCRAARGAGARHIDVFCDEGYFSVAQSRRLLMAGTAAGLIGRIHADELALTGGARLAAELSCASADHLLRIGREEAEALAAAGVVATLCPVTALSMGVPPPLDELGRAGVPVALGSDHNPGTCGTTSMPLVIALAVAELGMPVAAALVAATSGSARSLRLGADRGTVAPGMRADLVVWDAPHEGAFAWSYGLEPRRVLLAGAPVS